MTEGAPPPPDHEPCGGGKPECPPAQLSKAAYSELLEQGLARFFLQPDQGQEGRVPVVPGIQSVEALFALLH